MPKRVRPASSTLSTRLAGVIVAFAVVVVMAGCGSSEEGASADPETGTQPTEEVSVAESSPNVAEAAAARIDEASIRESLAHLTGESPAPLADGPVTIEERGSEEGRHAAAEYIRSSFEAMGVPARILEFDLDDERGFNVEATLEGTSGGKHLWVTAHLDSVYNAGASDDASGLVSILMTARVLKQLDPEHTVHFVAYDQEEVGLVGSSRYVESVVSDVLRQEGEGAIIGNLHTDMIGYDEGEFEAVMGTCNQAGPIDDAILRASEIIDSPLDVSDDCLRRSDHEHFWNAGYPAVIMTDSTKYDGYPWYHKATDTIDKLNLPYLRSVIQLNAAATALLAES
ncbi:MAG: M28 family peptidase [Actinomycetota bacterium]|nr:M28 family peptidase [Actinomycetota bacterium]